MLGRSHVMSGVVVGLAVAPLVGLHGLAQIAPFTLTTAGWCLAPDLDCPGSTATRMLGPVTGTVSRGLSTASAWLYQRTKGPRDEDSHGTHRHLTHTLLWCLLLTVLAAGTSLLNPWVVLGWVAFGVLGAQAVHLVSAKLMRNLTRGCSRNTRDTVRWVLRGWPTLAAVVTVVPLFEHTQDPAIALAGMQGWIGLAVGLGCVTHLLGDAVTRSGIPALFPILIAGETWYEVKLLGRFAFTTGKEGGVERRLIFPALTVGAFLLLPGFVPAIEGAWPAVADMVRHAARM